MSQSTIRMLSFIMDVVVPIIVVVFVGAFFGIRYAKKKGYIKGKQKKNKEVYSKNAKKVSIDEFNVVEDFEDNIIVTENKTRFTSGVICEGVSIANLSSFERNMIEKNTLGYNTMIAWDIQYYIQTVQADSEEITQFTRESIDAINAEYANLSLRLTQLTEAVGKSPEREEYYREDIEETKRLLKCLANSLNDKDEIMAYCKAVTMPGSEPQFNLFILCSYVYDESIFTEQLTYPEILKEAHNFMETKKSAIRDAMKKCMVKCRDMSQLEICEMLHRGYNLKDSSIVKFKDLLKTSQFDLYTTSNYFEQSRLINALEIIDKELSGKEAAADGETKE